MARVVLVTLLLASCAQAPVQEQREPPWRRYLPPPAVAATNIVQGTFGLTEFRDSDITVAAPGVDVRESGIQTFPMLGGSVQRVLRNERVQIGVEGGFTFGWDSDTTIIAAGNGAIVTQRDNDIFILDGFVGVYVNIPMQNGWRVYAGAGPVLQYGSVQYEFLDAASEPERFDDDGLGGGWYARTGFEIDFGGNTMVGIGVRWIDTYVDFGGGIQDIQLEGMQAGLTVSQSF